MWDIRLIFLDKDKIILKGEQKEGYKKPHGAIIKKTSGWALTTFHKKKSYLFTTQIH